MSIWGFITDLGDTAVTVPLALLMLCFLAATKQLRLAIGWIIAILACTAVIGGLKLVLDACGSLLASAGLASPSGHTAMSTVVYGGFAAVIGTRLARPARAALIAGAAALIIAMPLSRIILHVHTPIEVVVGLAVGLAALAIIVSVAAIRRRGYLSSGSLPPLSWSQCCSTVSAGRPSRPSTISPGGSVCCGPGAVNAFTGRTLCRRRHRPRSKPAGGCRIAAIGPALLDEISIAD